MTNTPAPATTVLIADLLERHRRESGGGLERADVASTVRDLLTDLWHHCNDMGLDMNELASRAEKVWTEESAEGLTAAMVPATKGAPKWLVEFLENYAADVRNNERHTAKDAAQHIMRYV